MGCAASADTEVSRNKDREPTTKAVPSSKFAPQTARPPYVSNNKETDGADRNRQNSPPGGGASSSRQDVHNNSSTNLLTQSLLSDLRLRSSKEGPGIPRWVEGIVLPSEEDNVDLYDPLRRHKLAMESISTRQKKPSSNGGGVAGSSSVHSTASLNQSNKKPSSDASNGSQHNGTEVDAKDGADQASSTDGGKAPNGAVPDRSPRPAKSQSNKADGT